MNLIWPIYTHCYISWISRPRKWSYSSSLVILFLIIPTLAIHLRKLINLLWPIYTLWYISWISRPRKWPNIHNYKRIILGTKWDPFFRSKTFQKTFNVLFFLFFFFVSLNREIDNMHRERDIYMKVFRFLNIWNESWEIRSDNLA